MPPAPATKRILIVDDNLQALRALQHILEREGFQVDAADCGEAAVLQLEQHRYDALLTDLRMPGMDGIALCERARALRPALPVILLTAHGSVPSTVSAVRHGAFDVLQKPYRSDEILTRLREATERATEPPVEAPPKRAEPRGLEAIIGASEAMTRVLGQIRTVATKDISVIILGESGTGKELAARAIHTLSTRSSRPFVAVNCASIPETLLENELFGHVKGAYTGASSNQRGLFEEAHTGSIFLDEIGDIPGSIQAKLLRVLQEQEFKKIGGTRDVRVDVRLITATNKDLSDAVARGAFREDLYYRINVVPLRMPALRERVEDIPILAHHFRHLFNAELGTKVRDFSDEALQAMLQHPWAGNVRELRNRVKRALVLATDTVVGPSELGLADATTGAAIPTFRAAKASFERSYLLKALKLCGGNVKKAAKLAGRDRSTFYDLLNKHEISADRFRDLY